MTAPPHMTVEELRTVVFDRLAEFERGQQSIQRQLELLTQASKNLEGTHLMMIQSMERTQAEHSRSLYGQNGDPGIRIRLDRQERTIAAWNWHLRAIWAATIAFAFKLMQDIFQK